MVTFCYRWQPQEPLLQVAPFWHCLGLPPYYGGYCTPVGYAEPPRYFWSEVVTEGQWWCNVKVTVPTHVDNPQRQGWSIESDGQTPWEGAQGAAFEVLN